MTADTNKPVDCELVITGEGYGRVDLAFVTDFRFRRAFGSSDVTKDWQGSFAIESDTLTAGMFILRVDPSHPPATLYQYVTEADGSVSTYQYDDVTFKHGAEFNGRHLIEFFAAWRRWIER